MSCWVVPTVAAEYWGISLDVVWRRITDGLVPHKSDSGFLFVDVDPWAATCTGALRHRPPPTFVITADAPSAVESPMLWPVMEPPVDLPAVLLSELSENGEESNGQTQDDELPELDEEETATFGRLTWSEVRQQVSRTRRPPSYHN
jgi:hypothetical protein